MKTHHGKHVWIENISGGKIWGMITINEKKQS